MLDTRMYRRMKEVPVKFVLNGEEAMVFNISEGGALVEKIIGTLKVNDVVNGKFRFEDGSEQEVASHVLRIQERSIALSFDEKQSKLMSKLK